MNDTATLQILSAGAPKTGVRHCAESFAERSGTRFELEFATAPVLRERISEGSSTADVLVAPEAVMRELSDAGRVDPAGVVTIGSVTAGVVVRNGAHEPDLSSIDAFTAALCEADSIVFNRASSGQYIEKMLDRLSLLGELGEKIIRTKTGAAVMEFLAADTHERAIGFGQITEIRLQEHLGVHLVGPLPTEIGNVTVYQAVALGPDSPLNDHAQSLVDFMVSTPGRELFVASGVT